MTTILSVEQPFWAADLTVQRKVERLVYLRTDVDECVNCGELVRTFVLDWRDRGDPCACLARSSLEG